MPRSATHGSNSSLISKEKLFLMSYTWADLLQGTDYGALPSAGFIVQRNSSSKNQQCWRNQQNDLPKNPWRLSNLTRQRPWATCSNWTCAEQEIGLEPSGGVFQNTQFCDSMNFSVLVSHWAQILFAHWDARPKRKIQSWNSFPQCYTGAATIKQGFSSNFYSRNNGIPSCYVIYVGISPP